MTFLLKLLKKPKKIKRKRTVVLRTKGEVYDLHEIYHSLNAEYFSSELDLKITWFGRGEKVPKTRMLFGSYYPNLALIKVNRLLDDSKVPLYFIRFIIYHEMLHHTHPPLLKRGEKRKIHHPGFKAKEKEFKDHTLAQDYLKTWKGLRHDP